MEEEKYLHSGLQMKMLAPEKVVYKYITTYSGVILKGSGK